jgi:signal transduction histidine kinase
VKKRRYWLWVTLFIGVALVLGTLAMGWNLVLVRDYQRMVALARSLSQTQPIGDVTSINRLITSIVLGSLGFFTVLGVFIAFFFRLLHEMRTNQQQTEFLATVTHELKTPIAAIELASTLLRDESLSNEETEKLWNSHQAELARLRADVETLLEAARWQSVSVEVSHERVDLETWLANSMERWRSILGPSAEIIREGDKLNGPALLDLRKLNLISDNILENSRKYAKGSPKVVVRTSLMRSNLPLLGQLDRWQIEFQDFGWGFDPKDSKKILKPFYRAKSPIPYAVPGNGLGLYIASSASHALGMKMRGSSPGHGHGATFSLEGHVRSEPSS